MPFIKLDKQISSAVQNFKESLNTIDFDMINSIEFILSDKLKEEFNTIPLSKGLYFFELKIPKDHEIHSEIKYDIFNFNKTWKDESVQHMWSPGMKIKRCKIANRNIENYLNEEYIPFYVGKSNCLIKRIKQHIFQNPLQTTFGMKLISRKNLYGVKIRVSIIEINVDYSNMIIPYMENHFREKLNPIIGQ